MGLVVLEDYSVEERFFEGYVDFWRFQSVVDDAVYFAFYCESVDYFFDFFGGFVKVLYGVVYQVVLSGVSVGF